ncbi:MAG TPA: hypothetical protein VLM78_06435, partial [Anaerolineales bacterium]|nr:hypothetical protein [Anaerolineales bacterium]
MRRNTSALRLSLTLLLLAGLFFGAVGQSLARGEVVAPVAQATPCLGSKIAEWTFTGYSSTHPL